MFKPDNVIVSHDGHAWVADFGLARTTKVGASVDCRCSRATPPASGPQPEVILGTPAYMAPEQFRDPEVDARADQFSFD